MSHVTHMNDSCRTYEWVMSRISMNHVAHMNESCHTYEWVVSHIWLSHVTYMSGICDVPHTYRNTCRFRLVRSSSRRVAVSISAPYSIGIRFIGFWKASNLRLKMCVRFTSFILCRGSRLASCLSYAPIHSSTSDFAPLQNYSCQLASRSLPKRHGVFFYLECMASRRVQISCLFDCVIKLFFSGMNCQKTRERSTCACALMHMYTLEHRHTHKHFINTKIVESCPQIPLNQS